MERRCLSLLDREPLLSQIEAERIASIRQDIVHGEVGLAVESLIENLHDVAKPPSAAWLAELEKIAADLKLDTSYLKTLRELRAKA